MSVIDLKTKKRDMCIEFIKLGMDFDTACIASEIDDKEKEELAADEEFISTVNFTLARKESELLKKLNQVAEENAERGDTRQLERMLELLNPARYSKVTKLSHQMDNSGGASGKVTVEFTGDSKE